MSFRANAKFGNATLIPSNGEFSGIDVYLYKDLPNLYVRSSISKYSSKVVLFPFSVGYKSYPFRHSLDVA